MQLEVLDIDVGDRTLPEPVALFLAAAEARIEAFAARRTVSGFVRSDFPQVYPVLRALRDQDLLSGPLFLEWGSGFGVVAMLAALVGFDAYGIEIDAELVEESRALAAEHGLDVEFAQGTFVPPGGEAALDAPDAGTYVSPSGTDGYAELGLDVRDFDVVFAYPWPGEEVAIEGLFAWSAAPGALLVTYEGIEAVRVQRKPYAF